MSDNLNRYRAIGKGLAQCFPKQLTPCQWQHFRVMAAMINGIVGSRHVHLPKLADKFPMPADRESRIKRFARWLQNAEVTQASYFAPFAEALLAGLACQPLVVVIDASAVGRGCQCLMVISWWRENCAEPLYLVTNLALAEEACAYYQQRFLIETFFSDQKSRGFQLHKSHLHHP